MRKSSRAYTGVRVCMNLCMGVIRLSVPPSVHPPAHRPARPPAHPSVRVAGMCKHAGATTQSTDGGHAYGTRTRVGHACDAVCAGRAVRTCASVRSRMPPPHARARPFPSTTTTGTAIPAITIHASGKHTPNIYFASHLQDRSFNLEPSSSPSTPTKGILPPLPATTALVDRHPFERT